MVVYPAGDGLATSCAPTVAHTTYNIQPRANTHHADDADEDDDENNDDDDDDEVARPSPAG